MATKLIPSGETFLHAGQPVDSFWYITSGTVRASFTDGFLTLHKGDIIGLVDFDQDSHFLTYTALENTELLPYGNPQQLVNSGFLADKPEHMAHLALSMNNTLSEMIHYYDSLQTTCQELYHFLLSSNAQYKKLCNELHVVIKELSSIEELEPLGSEYLLPDWQHSFQNGIHTILNRKEMQDVSCSQDIIPGYLYHASADFHELLQNYQLLYEYLTEMSRLLLNENRLDLFDLFTGLSLRVGSQTAQSEVLSQTITNMVKRAENLPGISRDLIQSRWQEYQIRMEKKEKMQATAVSSSGKTDSRIGQKLSNSLHQILEYADCSPEETDEFLRLLSEYKELPDKNSGSNEAIKCRKALTAAFYRIYISAFQISLSEKTIPTVLKMFFNFGYVDAELCGMECAVFLYELAEHFGHSQDLGVYTIYEWLQAIYSGQKNPSINEFEEDFEKHVRSLKTERGLPDEVAARMSKDRAMMVMYELNNMFQSASKIANGHLATFCPVLSEHQFLKPPQDALLYPDQIIQVENALRQLDYSLFYREVNTVLSERENIHDFLHVEVLPDIILMPVVGTRGVMWQEISDKNRKNPARMMLPVFQLEDLTKVMMHMAGEYRWEICKRTQGGRWNDVSDPSLTSLYCDYLQFYKKNSDLSSENKEKVKLSLQRNKQSFKSVFVSDYITYMTYESSGSPHLNRVARSILFQFCPFSQKARTHLVTNPIYQDVLDKYRIRTAQKVHKLDNLQKKLEAKREPVPPILLQEIEYFGK